MFSWAAAIGRREGDWLFAAAIRRADRRFDAKIAAVKCVIARDLQYQEEAGGVWQHGRQRGNPR